MRIDTVALAASFALIWAAAVLFAACANLAWPGYARAFLQLVASIYPGYDAGRSAGQVVLATVYALIDGAGFGLVLGWLYNRFSR